MTWTADEQAEIANAILGSWPGTVTQWGKTAFAAYVSELQARGLTAESVLVAVRMWPAGSDFPPSAPNLADRARKDPDVPTFAEMCVLVFGPGGVLKARSKLAKARWEPGERDRLDEQAMMERAESHGALVAGFVAQQTVGRLRGLGLDDPEYGQIRRRDLEREWTEFLSVQGERDVMRLVAGVRRGGLSRPSFAAIESGQ